MIEALGRTDKFTKGFLYEIRSQKNLLVGYLFGTIHKLDRPALERLHPVILTCFDNASHVFMELVADNEDYELIVTLGVDDFLCKRAFRQGKSISGLETKESRAKISARLEADKEHALLLHKVRGIITFLFMAMLEKYNHIAELTKHMQDINAIFTVYEETRKCLQLLVHIIESMEFAPKELEKKLFTMVEKMTCLLCALKLLPDDEQDILEQKLSFRTNQHLSVIREIQKRYVDGDDTEFKVNSPEEVLYPELVKIKRALALKELQARDAIMAENLHNDIEMTIAAKEKRCGFYAVGSKHVKGFYPNSLPELLKAKGWILNKVELYHLELYDLSLIQHSIFSDAETLIQMRHNTPETQAAYDRKFGLVLKPI